MTDSQQPESPRLPDRRKPDARPSQPAKPDRPPKSGRARVVRVASPEESQLQTHELAHHRSTRRKRRAKPEIGQLNLTSMIDVIFLLLIYFVVTANFVENEGVLVAKLPSDSGPLQKQDELPKLPLDIVLRSYDQSQCRIEIRGRRIESWGELARQLMALQNDPVRGRTGDLPIDNPIVIRPGAQVRWEHVVNAFNTCIKSGYTNVNFAQSASGG